MLCDNNEIINQIINVVIAFVVHTTIKKVFTCSFPKEFTFNQTWGFDDYWMYLLSKYKVLQQSYVCHNFTQIEHVTY